MPTLYNHSFFAPLLTYLKNKQTKKKKGAEKKLYIIEDAIVLRKCDVNLVYQRK